VDVISDADIAWAAEGGQPGQRLIDLGPVGFSFVPFVSFVVVALGR
jgi:hypothetical protein